MGRRWKRRKEEKPEAAERVIIRHSSLVIRLQVPDNNRWHIRTFACRVCKKEYPVAPW